MPYVEGFAVHDADSQVMELGFTSHLVFTKAAGLDPSLHDSPHSAEPARLSA